jgi:hypothetical protein
MVPVAINLPPLTNSNVIGWAIAPSGCGSGTRRLSPPGNNGARIDGSMPGRFSAGEPSSISAGVAAGPGSAIHPCMLARSTASLERTVSSASIRVIGVADRVRAEMFRRIGIADLLSPRVNA